MATYIVSAAYKNGCFGFTMHRSNQQITDPETINECAMGASLVNYGKVSIGQNIYEKSPLRQIHSKSMFGNYGSRFDMEFGILNILNFLDSKLNIGDILIFAGVDYIRPLVRGASEIQENFEIDIINHCCLKRAMFTNSLFKCNFSQIINETKTDNKQLISLNDFSWIK